ncbi:hypothetical protein LTR37_019417 [Vermiconidia calcicola]|uniref:Uncharacterized protein n=1 Tax=Vermiconidia calcicola TaxID=1690605 RepID=A0ACC3MFB4_9PEZI|nr:hypothetical protein LTR37_019417 [Vermiconidia calcicola]
MERRPRVPAAQSQMGLASAWTGTVPTSAECKHKEADRAGDDGCESSRKNPFKDVMLRLFQKKSKGGEETPRRKPHFVHMFRRSAFRADLRSQPEEAVVERGEQTERSRRLCKWSSDSRNHVLTESGLGSASPTAGGCQESGGDISKTRRFPHLSEGSFSRAGEVASSFSRKRLPGDQAGVRPSDVRSMEDLQNRLVKLETVLRDFRITLGRFTKEGDPRANATTERPQRPNLESHYAFATLADDSEEIPCRSSYDYDSTRTQYPINLSRPPETRFSSTELSSNPSSPIQPEGASSGLFCAPSPLDVMLTMPGDTEQGSGQSASTHACSISLFEMVNDERSARASLEVCIRDLKQEVRDLHHIVFAQENVQDQLNSIMPAHNTSTLTIPDAYQHEGESSPLNTASSQQENSDAVSLLENHQTAISRFSFSDSELDVEQENAYSSTSF